MNIFLDILQALDLIPLLRARPERKEERCSSSSTRLKRKKRDSSTHAPVVHSSDVISAAKQEQEGAAPGDVVEPIDSSDEERRIEVRAPPELRSKLLV